MKVSTIRSRTRLVLLFATMLVLLPFQAVAVVISPHLSLGIPVLFHRICARILGIHIRVHGQAVKTPSTLFVSNHSSYLDITILGALLRASFIAKAEIEKWPVFGMLGKLQRSVFIKRERRNTANQKSQIETRLAKGDSLILFAEGTTSDGCRTLPFYSSLFESAHSARIIQPVSIVFTEIDRIPAGRTMRMIYAWPGDLTLAPHFMEIMRQGDLTIDVIFHEPITPADFKNRKLLSEACYQKVSRGVSDLISGREIKLQSAA